MEPNENYPSGTINIFKMIGNGLSTAASHMIIPSPKNKEELALVGALLTNETENQT